MIEIQKNKNSINSKADTKHLSKIYHNIIKLKKGIFLLITNIRKKIITKIQIFHAPNQSRTVVLILQAD